MAVQPDVGWLRDFLGDWRAGILEFWVQFRRVFLVHGSVGVPFVVIGQYLIWGRFIYAAWKKKRTHYAVTTRRLIVVQNGWKTQMAAVYVENLPTVTIESGSGGCGTLRFAQQDPMWARRGEWGAWDGISVGGVPTFVDIEDVDAVYRLISDLREKSSSAKVFS